MHCAFFLIPGYFIITQVILPPLEFVYKPSGHADRPWCGPTQMVYATHHSDHCAITVFDPAHRGKNRPNANTGPMVVVPLLDCDVHSRRAFWTILGFELHSIAFTQRV